MSNFDVVYSGRAQHQGGSCSGAPAGANPCSSPAVSDRAWMCTVSNPSGVETSVRSSVLCRRGVVNLTSTIRSEPVEGTSGAGAQPNPGRTPADEVGLETESASGPPTEGGR